MEILKAHSAYGLGVRYADAILGRYAGEGGIAAGWGAGTGGGWMARQHRSLLPSRRPKIGASASQSTQDRARVCCWRRLIRVLKAAAGFSLDRGTLLSHRGRIAQHTLALMRP